MSDVQRSRPKRTIIQSISWWWQTRVKSLWTVRLPAMFNRASQVKTTFEFDHTPGAITVPDDDNSITAILTVYTRSEYLQAQVDALKAQTVPPDEIWVWCNSSDELIPDVSSMVDRVIISNSNWKFFGRFALATMARTKHVCIFDDDILPQPQWLENCLDVYASGIDGILGGAGALLEPTGGYSSKNKVGWNGHHLDEATQVDLSGQCWFFKKTYAKYMWIEDPPNWDNGEDIHFSYMALKHGGVKTWVPPHPESQPERWACRPDFGKRVGRTKAAVFKSEGHHEMRDEIVENYRRDGWVVVSAQVETE